MAARRVRNQSLLFQARGFGSSSTILTAKFKVAGYTNHVIGGPRVARVLVSGDEGSILTLKSLLRTPVEIFDEEVDRVWWGYVHRATVRIGNIALSWSLDSMGNRVSVVYTRQTPTAGGSRKAQTAWVEDATSILEYGTKERIITLANGDDAYADGYAANQLRRIGQPIKETELTNAQTYSISGELECRGWFDTLGWIYYNQPAGLVQYSKAGGTSANLPLSPGEIAQSFVLADTVGWDARAVAFRIKSADGPTDDVTVSICSDSAGAPGAVLGSATVSATTLGNSASWAAIELAAVVPLAPATTYWLKIARSSAATASKISVDLDESVGYADGAFRIWNGSSWSARSPDADLMFQVLGEQDSALQVPPLVTATGQFLTAAIVQRASGMFTNQYRDGSRTGLQELLDILNLGDGDGQRLLARVDASRQLLVEPEPPAPSSTAATPYYYLTTQNEILTSSGIKIPNAAAPYGIWVRPQALIDHITDTDPIFIDGSEYDSMTDTLRFIARDQNDPRAVAKVKDR